MRKKMWESFTNTNSKKGSIFPKSSVSKTEILNKLRKMITFILKAIILRITSVIILISNPVKIRILLLAVSIILFTLIFLIRGRTWFPTLFALLFMGGILIIFIILSSILPNEKRTKIKILYRIIILRAGVAFFVQKFRELNNSFRNTKRFLSSRFAFYFIILILILYFFSVISILSKEEIPMRIVLCCERN